MKYGYQLMRVNLWKLYDVNIKILIGLDAADRDASELIVKTAIDQGSVDGIFNLAVSLKDSFSRNQTPETFEESFKGKAWATKCLDEVTRKLCPDLRHFVVFSSVSCGKGNAGQTNYGMANSIMERICEKRVEEGLPGLAIQWGAIGDVGLVADMQNEDKELDQKYQFLTSGIKDLNNINPNSFLLEFGMDSISAVEIKQTLRREYEIYLTTTDIRNLNLVKLVDMNNNLTENSNPNKNETNQLISIRNRIEGYANAFKTLESKIKSPATCFQFETNYKLKTVEAMANSSLPENLHLSSQEELKNNILLDIMNAYVNVNAVEHITTCSGITYNYNLALRYALHYLTLPTSEMYSPQTILDNRPHESDTLITSVLGYPIV
ncbi:hypothetical protein HZH68_004062 [Vespula germanica]|uniref:Carrier domain-containing protein n=1 Tax=Vespula germanica TaxID=30212 RepID=A0A834KT65_VESGE|nr:hypothetical protein HZH68_004062 [Vespula germanica]